MYPRNSNRIGKCVPERLRKGNDTFYAWAVNKAYGI